MIEIKPCPFCGAPMNLSAHGDIVGWHKIGCFLEMLDADEVNMTEEEIRVAFVEAWNRRAE